LNKSPLFALLIVISLAVMLPAIYGIPLYMQDLPQAFKGECTTCHTSASGMGGLNRFGADFSNSGHSLDQIRNLDSDGDGYTNAQEFSEGTFPGDPRSYPGSNPFPIGVDVIVFIATAVIAAIAVARFVIFRS
jgi:hypothetical protein